MAMHAYFLYSLSILFALFSVFFSYKLFKESEGSKYWFFIFIASVSLLITAFFASPFSLIFPDLVDSNILDYLSSVFFLFLSFSLCYALYGLYDSLRELNKEL